jgi:hypothetical protein
MYIVVIAWMFVVVLMSAAEAMSPQGSLLGAIVTFMLYGALPLSIVVYVMGAPARYRRRKALEAAQTAQAAEAAPALAGVSSLEPDAGGHAAGDAVAPVRKEPRVGDGAP